MAGAGSYVLYELYRKGRRLLATRRNRVGQERLTAPARGPAESRPERSLAAPSRRAPDGSTVRAWRPRVASRAGAWRVDPPHVKTAPLDASSRRHRSSSSPGQPIEARSTVSWPNAITARRKSFGLSYTTHTTRMSPLRPFLAPKWAHPGRGAVAFSLVGTAQAASIRRRSGDSGLILRGNAAQVEAMAESRTRRPWPTPL